MHFMANKFYGHFVVTNQLSERSLHCSLTAPCLHLTPPNKILPLFTPLNYLYLDLSNIPKFVIFVYQCIETCLLVNFPGLKAIS
jgi:hypothetical protein